MIEGISLLVTDVDNTLFDWVEAWFHSFSAMLDETVRLTGIPRERLIPEIKAVHQRHGTSEYAFLLNELPSLRHVLGDSPVLPALAPAIAAFREARDKHLRLYPGVAETLKKIKEAGTIVVGYTESMEPYTVYRLKYLGLDGLLDILFAPKGHEIPANINQAWFEHHRFFRFSLQNTQRRYTPSGHFKPDPEILLEMMDELGADPARTVYVGDSMMKDVVMAQRAGVHDALAQYGAAQRRFEYELLRDVTHWSPEDVERERAIAAGATDIKATRTLQRSFSELFQHFAFTAP